MNKFHQIVNKLRDYNTPLSAMDRDDIVSCLESPQYNEDSELPIDVLIGVATYKKGVKFKLVVDRLIREQESGEKKC
jgi:hypothetical protein